ncbi:MAG TPA: ABC transporter ATP-binding protein [Candidatus Scatovivens faecipullorum]|nr:ABC transporter ATP-binding protein [Candidatus Scatovivens faecipullorum]
MTILEVENIKVSYSNHIALENINFKIEEGEYVCLVGENGSGKSTLIKTIVGLLKQEEGKVGLNISLDEVSYLSQTNLKDLNFPATSKEIIMSGLQKHGKIPFYTKKDKDTYAKIIKQLKIEDIQYKRIGDLSGGQKQRVLIARALIREPKLLILDEPATGLDYNITKELYKILEKQNKENKMTIIMATHDLDEIQEIKPRIIYLAKTIKYDGTFEGWKGF